MSVGVASTGILLKIKTGRTKDDTPIYHMTIRRMTIRNIDLTPNRMRARMKDDQKAELKRHIRKRIAAVKEDIASYAQLTRPVSPDSAIGRITRMEAINSKSINEAALHKAKDTLIGLERALSNMDSSGFGLCRQCEEPIPPARLMILPEAEHCVKCAENIDQ